MCLRDPWGIPVTMKPEELRAARQLLGIDQNRLAEAARVSIATVKRFEQGRSVGHAFVVAMRRAAEGLGVMIVADGADVGGRRARSGVVLLGGPAPPGAEPPPQA